MITKLPNPLANARAHLQTAQQNLDKAIAAADAPDAFVGPLRHLTSQRSEKLGGAFLAGNTNATAACVEIDKQIAALNTQAATAELDRAAARAAVILGERRRGDAVETLRVVEAHLVATELEAARHAAALAASNLADAVQAIQITAAEYMASARLSSQLARRLRGRPSADAELAIGITHSIQLPDMANGGAVFTGLSPDGEAALSAAWNASVERLSAAGIDINAAPLIRPRVEVAAQDDAPRPVTITRFIPDPVSGRTIATVERADATMPADDWAAGTKVVLVG